MSLLAPIEARWSRPNGYAAVLRIGMPLVISMTSHTVMLFTDRLFLSHYSLDALAASTPGGLLAFLFMSFFTGIAGFANTFVAQYIGANAPRRVGAVLWQAIYFAVAGGALMAALSFVGGPIFALAGHDPQIRVLETVYFSVLMQGAVFHLLHYALSGFYAGRGLTGAIMVVNLIGMALNVPLDYLLINGLYGLPEMGIAGSAVATVASHAAMLAIFIALIFRKKHEQTYAVRSQRAFDGSLFARLIKFGAPAGLQLFMDLLSFVFLLLMIGRIGRHELAATNLAFALNTLCFMPMIGFSIALSTLVGQAIGRKQPEDAVMATGSAMHLTCAYMWSVALIFVLFPSGLCNIFRSSGQTAADFAAVRDIATVLLRFVALYSILDTFNVIYAGALKGAGDTKFIGWIILILGAGLVIIPVYFAVIVFQAGLFTVWTFATSYVCLLAAIFYWRYSRGHWKRMSVIESPAVAANLVGYHPGVPVADELQ